MQWANLVCEGYKMHFYCADHFRCQLNNKLSNMTPLRPCVGATKGAGAGKPGAWDCTGKAGPGVAKGGGIWRATA